MDLINISDGGNISPNPPTVMNHEKERSPRFLIIKRKDQTVLKNFDKISPFVIHKKLFGVVGNLKSIKKIREGLLVETVSPAQSALLMRTTSLFDIDVTIEAHRTLNIIKGVIYSRDLLNCTVEEILLELKSKGVTDVRRIKSKVNGELVDTPNHILTFNGTKLPATVHMAYLNLPVRLYIPAPLRCFRCQKFGHTSIKCTSDQICVCGLPLHEGSSCREPITCIHCEGNHSARSRNCPVYRQEMAIQEVKTRERITYLEAKKRVVIPTP